MRSSLSRRELINHSPFFSRPRELLGALLEIARV